MKLDSKALKYVECSYTGRVQTLL